MIINFKSNFIIITIFIRYFIRLSIEFYFKIITFLVIKVFLKNVQKKIHFVE